MRFFANLTHLTLSLSLAKGHFDCETAILLRGDINALFDLCHHLSTVMVKLVI
jgi:hypothetical protein